MRAVSLLAVTAGFLSPFVAADWYMYLSQTFMTIDGTSIDQYQVFDAPPDCNDAINSPVMEAVSDVSGNKKGVRCKGCNLTGDEANPTEMEIHTDDVHVTWYADRNGDLVRADDSVVVGNCHVDTSDGFDCVDSAGGAWMGFSQIFCTTDVVIEPY